MDNNGAAYYRTGSHSYYYPCNRTENLNLDGAPKYRFPPIVNEISRPPTLAKPIDVIEVIYQSDFLKRPLYIHKKTPCTYRMSRIISKCVGFRTFLMNHPTLS